MLRVHWFAVEGDPSGYLDYSVNAVLLMAGIACMSLISWLTIRNARRGGAGLQPRLSQSVALIGVVIFALAVLWISPPLLFIRSLAVLATLSAFAFVWFKSCMASRTALHDVVSITLRGGCLGAGVLLAVAFPPMESKVTGEGLIASQVLAIIDLTQIANVDGYLPLEDLLARQDMADRLRYSMWDVSSIPTRAGRGINMADEYLVSLTPKKYMHTAQFTIIMYHCDGANYAYYKDTRGLPVSDFPLDPEAQGWLPLWPNR